MQAEQFFVPSFLNAINEGTEDSFRSVMDEPSPGVFTFEMLQPHLCELLLAEVSFGYKSLSFLFISFSVFLLDSDFLGGKF